MIDKWNILLRKLTPRCYSLGNVEAWGRSGMLGALRQTEKAAGVLLELLLCGYLLVRTSQPGRPVCFPGASAGSPHTLLSAVEVEWQSGPERGSHTGLHILFFFFQARNSTNSTSRLVY